MNTCLLGKDIVSGILKDSMSLLLSLGMMLSSNNFSNIRLNNLASSMVNSINSSVSNSRATFFLLGFRRGPVNNISSFLETRNGVAFWMCLLISMPTCSSLIHSLFAWDLMFCSVFCDKLVPGFRHLLFCIMDIKTQCLQVDGLHT